MKRTLVFIGLGILAQAAIAETFMKPGLWEVRIVKQVMDGKDMSAQMASAQAMMQEKMAAMSPAQRKQMEQIMGGQAMPSQGAQRICISQEMASRDKPMMPPDAKCEPTKFDRSGNKMTFEINCTADGRTTTGKGETVGSGDAVTSRMDMVVSDAKGRHTMQHESQLKFIGADCQGIKPVDQLMKSMNSGKGK